MKRKKIPTEIMMGILLCLLIISSVKSGLTILKLKITPQIAEKVQPIFSESDSGCATMIILKSLLKENQKVISFGAQSQSTASIRPTDPGGGIDGNQHLLPKLYNTTHFVIHWTNGTDGGSSTDAPLPNTDANGNQIPDVVENWGAVLEDVWSFEINIRGFPAPPSDTAEPNDIRNRNPDGRYDVFIYFFGYFGYAYPERWPNSPSYSYIGLRNTLGYLELRQVVAAHEFFHAIQFVYDCAEEDWWLEATATYMEDEVYPNVNRNYQNLPNWFEYSDSYGLEHTNGNHEYGDFIFVKRLSEDFGDNIIKEIFQEMVNANGIAAINNVLLSRNSSFLNEFSKFITANFFLEEMYVDGADYRANVTGKTTFNGVWLEYQYDASIAPDFVEINSSNVNKDTWMDKWATDYLILKLDPAKTEYRISFDGLDLTTNYLVKLVSKKEGIINESSFNLDAQKDGYLDFNYDTFENVTLIIANAGDTVTANPSWKVTIEVLETIPIYDVAVINVRSSTYSAVVGQTIDISATVRNNGNTRNESFNVSIWWGNFSIETLSVMLPPASEEILIINWTPEITGSEIIWANATIVANETNIENNLFEGEVLTVRERIHDLAITDMKAQRYANQLINLTVSVRVENQGDFNETFQLLIYANQKLIENQTITLESGVSKNFLFEWNVSDWNLGTYLIRAVIPPVPGEIDLNDNQLIGEKTTITRYFLFGPFYSFSGIEYWVAGLIDRPCRLISNF